MGKNYLFVQKLNTEGVVENQAEIDSWTEKDAMASALIYSNVEMAYQTSLGGSVDAAEMWRRMNQQHAQIAAANSEQLTAKLCSTV